MISGRLTPIIPPRYPAKPGKTSNGLRDNLRHCDAGARIDARRNKLRTSCRREQRYCGGGLPYNAQRSFNLLVGWARGTLGVRAR
jgi:hypothetical protein